MRGDVFKIVIGDGWCADPSIDPELVSAPVESIDFGRVRDVVDIVVDGTSICGRMDEDSIFYLVRDLLGAVEKLYRENEATRISFYEGPWELILQRLGSDVYITFYRSGRRPQVIVKDQVVPFNQLVQGVVTSATQLLKQAEDVDPKANDDPLVIGMREALKRIANEKELDAELPGSPSSVTRIVKSTRWTKPRSKDSFSFGFQILAKATDLLTPGKPKGSDLNALLFRGQQAVHARGRRVLLGKGFLFLQTERLLASLRQLLAAWEEGRPMSVRLISDGLVVGVRLGADDGLVVSLMDSSREDAIIVLNDLSPWEYADAVLGAGRELRRLIVEANPSQRRNLRLESFSREIKALANWSKEQQRGTVINKDVDRYRKLTHTRPLSAPPVSVGEASRLRFRERWRIEVEGPNLSGTVLCGDKAIISARGSMFGIDTETGAMAWRRDTDRSDARSQLAGPDGYVRAAPSGQVELIDVFTGVVKWRTTLAPRSGGAPVLLVIEHGPAPGLVISAEEERKIVALDMRSGEPRWRFTASRGGRFALRRYGRLLYIASNASHFNAVDVEDGTLVWRFTDRTRFIAPPAAHGDTLLVVGGRPGRPEGKMYALNAFSGERIWSTPLGGGAMTAPIISDGAALVPVRIGHHHEFVALDVESGEELWRRSCAGWADPSALMTLDKRFIVNAAGGMVHAIGARDGEDRWSSSLGPTCSDDVPVSLKVVLRGRMLFVPGDTVYVVRPDDGHIIHSLGGEPPVPDLLQVDPSCSVFVAEDSGHMAMYDLSSRLSVVS
ncbi:MAG: PQQ-binding-like beta-propeller repeat protein [Deltaproteobacteria bacterium]|nr:PQQ-binding-like beta-propeller repeat protein [Deltaproteobacteria bacterium]